MGGERDAAAVVVGIGNEGRGDDGAGPAAARRVAEAALPQLRVIQLGIDAAGLLDILTSARDVMVLDAMRSGRSPGTIAEYDAAREPLPRESFALTSSHALGVAEAIEIARALGRLPARLVVVGIEAGEAAAGSPLSGAVARAVEEVACRIVDRARRRDARA